MIRRFLIYALAVSLPLFVSCRGYVDTETPVGADDPETPVAPEIDPEELPSFVRHLCIMEFTGQWCAMCPDGYKILYNVAASEYSEYKDFTHIMALHDQDELSEPLQKVQKTIFDSYALSGYPSALVDLRDGLSLSDGSSGVLEEAILTSLNEPANCGVAVKSVYDAETSEAKVDAKLFSLKDGFYRIAVFVVEDGIKAKQNDGGRDRNYTHNHVARAMLSETYKGDSVGEVKMGGEVKKSYTLQVDSGWNPDKTSIYVLALYENENVSTVNNVAVCALNNGDMDYDYAENE